MKIGKFNENMDDIFAKYLDKDVDSSNVELTLMTSVYDLFAKTNVQVHFETTLFSHFFRLILSQPREIVDNFLNNLQNLLIPRWDPSVSIEDLPTS